MSTGATSRRWIGRILATGVATAVGLGLAPGTAVAASPDGAVQAVAPQDGAVHAIARPVQRIDPDTASSARRSWETRGRPDRMAIVREDRIDIVSRGRVTQQIPHRVGAVTLLDVDRALPPDWATITDGRAVLDATIVLVRDTTLEIGGPDSAVQTLQLAGGVRPEDAASIHTGGGHVTLTGVEVGSVDRETGQPVPPTADGRPMIVASTGGQLNSTDVTISDLGTPPTADDDAGAAVEFHTDSTGSLVRTTVRRGSAGVELSRSDGVRLEELTVSGSSGDGLVLSGDRGTTLSGVRATGNGENGVMVTGESSDRPITGITTSSNQDYGIAVVGQTGVRINGVSTSADTTGGLRISRSSGVTITDVHATEQRVGVYTHVSSSDIVLDGVHTNGGTRGLVIEKSSSEVEVRNSTFTGARMTGAALNGSGISLSGVQVRGSRSGVRVERGARDVRLDGLVVKGGHDGVVTAPGTSAVVMSDLVVDYVEADGIRTSSPGARITGARITGGTTGIDVAAGATITDTTVNASEHGIDSRSTERVHASRVTVDTLDVGVDNDSGGPFVLIDSQVHALESVRGEIDQQGVNDLSLPPLNLLGAIGVPLILLAIVLEELHSIRQRRLGAGNRKRRPPLSVRTQT